MQLYTAKHSEDVAATYSTAECWSATRK